MLQPGFPIRPLLYGDQATLPGKEQLTSLFLVIGNLTPISDEAAEANIQVRPEFEIGPGPRAPEQNGQSSHPNSFLLPPSRAVVIDTAKQDQPQAGLGLGAGRLSGCNPTLSVSLPDNTKCAL